MGLAFSCPGDDALDEGFEALLMRSISLNGENVKSTLRSVSFNGRDSEPAILKAFGSGKLIIEGSLSFRSRETDPFQLETTISITSPTSDKENPMKTSFKSSRFCPSKERTPTSPAVELSSPKHEAAVKLQKVYKSFRTRRQLADCAVLVEQRWWKLLDFALLKRSSISFFDIEEPESVVSRWLRARRRAATLGKGLSKDEKAQKLALQHWLEAIDPRHRYGHNLHFYYDCWLHCESKQPFFYWLDVGEGKEVNIEAKCTRSKLQQQCIKYLGPQEREAYEVIVEGGKFLHKQSGNVLDTSGGSADSKWIFVLSTSKTLYVGQKKKGTFQHSSFLAGGATSAAGRLVVEDGILKAVWPHSGHYRPTEENFQELMSYLKENNVDLTDVKQSPTEEGEELNALKSFRSELDLTIHSNIPKTEVLPSDASGDRSNSAVPKRTDTFKGLDFSAREELKSERDGTAKRSSYLHKVHSKINLENWEGSDDEEEANGETNCILESKRLDSNERSGQLDSSSDSQSSERKIAEDTSLSEEPYMFCKPNLFVEEEGEGEEASVPQESILRRINSKKGMKSYQLGKQLSCKWTTGAGPRIGCVRDYPSELQFRSLEQVNLSPRSDGASRNLLTQSPKPYISPRINSSTQSPKSYISPRNNTLIQSPRMQEMPLLRVPLLQKPNIHRYKR